LVPDISALVRVRSKDATNETSFGPEGRLGSSGVFGTGSSVQAKRVAIPIKIQKKLFFIFFFDYYSEIWKDPGV
jgi:hypothetical protein